MEKFLGIIALVIVAIIFQKLYSSKNEVRKVEKVTEVEKPEKVEEPEEKKEPEIVEGDDEALRSMMKDWLNESDD